MNLLWIVLFSIIATTAVGYALYRLWLFIRKDKLTWDMRIAELLLSCNPEVLFISNPVEGLRPKNQRGWICPPGRVVICAILEDKNHLRISAHKKTWLAMTEDCQFGVIKRYLELLSKNTDVPLVLKSIKTTHQ